MNNKSLKINKNSRLKNYIPKDQLIKKLEEQRTNSINPEEEKDDLLNQNAKSKNKFIKINVYKDDSKSFIENNSMEVIAEEP